MYYKFSFLLSFISRITAERGGNCYFFSFFCWIFISFYKLKTRIERRQKVLKSCTHANAQLLWKQHNLNDLLRNIIDIWRLRKTTVISVYIVTSFLYTHYTVHKQIFREYDDNDAIKPCKKMPTAVMLKTFNSTYPPGRHVTE